MRRGLVWSLIFIILLAAGSLTATILAGHHILRGLDLRGGVSVVLQPQGTATSAELQESVDIIENRVSGLNIANSSVSRQGDDVVIDLPDIKNPQQDLNELGKTATLYFRPVYCEIAPYVSPASNSTTTTVPKSGTTTVPKASTTVPASSSTTTKGAVGLPPSALNLAAASFPTSGGTSSTTAATTATTVASSPSTSTPPTTIISSSGSGTTVPVNGPVSQADCSASNSANIPSTRVNNDTATASVILPYYDGSVRYVLGPADMTGSVVSDATSEIDTSTGEYEVLLTLTNKGATEFDNIASVRNTCYKEDPSNPPACSLEAFELDGQVQSAPTFTVGSFQGQVVISGGTGTPFTQSQASQLSLVLKYGSLPVRFVPQSVETISASIGKDTLRAGILAGIGGIVVVMLYMLLYYRALALVVFTGLIIGGSILYSALAELSQGGHIALTLAGVTGIIVSVGITVDSYIVYFERLKDEVRSGRTVRQSVERSFTRAFRTVLTADLVSFLAALILYWFTIGDVRNFAFTLGLSTLLDVFTAYFFIRPAVIFVGRRRTFTDNRIFGIARGLGGRAATGEA